MVTYCGMQLEHRRITTHNEMRIVKTYVDICIKLSNRFVSLKTNIHIYMSLFVERRAILEQILTN